MKTSNEARSMETKPPRWANYAASKLAWVFWFCFLSVCCGAVSSELPKPGLINKEQRTQTPEELATFTAFVDLYLARIYGPFYASAARKFERFQQSGFHQIIVDRELSFAATKQGGSSGDEQRQATQLIRHTAAMRIETAQGADVLAAFTEYENDLRSQQTINLINQTLLFKGEPFDMRQYEYMISVFKKNAPNEKWIDFDEEQMGVYISARKQFHAKLLEEAKSILSPAQIGELKLEFDLEERQMPYYAMRNRQAKSITRPEDVNRP